MKIQIDWPEILQVSHSRIRAWRRCQMMHHYRYYQGLRKKVSALPLFVGTGIHAMLEAQVTRGDWKPEMNVFRSDFNKMFVEERAELGDVPGMVEGVVTGYFKHYEQDGLIYVPRHRGAKNEIKVVVDLDSHTRFLGYIDNFPQDEQGRSWVLDHKTCKSIPDENSRFADLQLLMYVWLLPQLGYEKPAGVIWDYIKKKAPTEPEQLKAGGLSRSAKIDSTYDVYMATVDRLLGPEARPEYEEFASTLKGREEKFYRRIYLPVNNSTMVDNVVRDVFSSAEEIRRAGPKAMVRNMTRDCNFCSYYSICQAEVRGLDSEFIRTSEYTTKEKLNATEENKEPGESSPEE